MYKESSAYSRQIREATVIMTEEKKGEGILNRKQEYNRCLVPTLGTLGTKTNLRKSKKSVEEKNLIQDPDERYREEEAENQAAISQPEVKKRTLEDNDREKAHKRAKKKYAPEERFKELRRTETDNKQKTAQETENARTRTRTIRKIQ